jgi:hypothetical protein
VIHIKFIEFIVIVDKLNNLDKIGGRGAGSGACCCGRRFMKG